MPCRPPEDEAETDPQYSNVDDDRPENPVPILGPDELGGVTYVRMTCHQPSSTLGHQRVSAFKIPNDEAI